MSKPKLKSCPFCGGKASVEPLVTSTVPLKKGEKRKTWTLCYFVECDCGGRMIGMKKQIAIARWNRRKGKE